MPTKRGVYIEVSPETLELLGRIEAERGFDMAQVVEISVRNWAQTLLTGAPA